MEQTCLCWQSPRVRFTCCGFLFHSLTQSSASGSKALGRDRGTRRMGPHLRHHSRHCHPCWSHSSADNSGPWWPGRSWPQCRPLRLPPRRRWRWCNPWGSPDTSGSSPWRAYWGLSGSHSWRWCILYPSCLQWDGVRRHISVRARGGGKRIKLYNF